MSNAKLLQKINLNLTSLSIKKMFLFDDVFFFQGSLDYKPKGHCDPQDSLLVAEVRNPKEINVLYNSVNI